MKILTVISNYNEEGAILDTINDIKNNNKLQSDILVIDNCSTDRSVEIIKASGVDYLSHPVNTGGSLGVIKTAFAYANYNDYDIYCHMDGDNQHKASELLKIVKPLIDNEADVVTGSRFIKKEGFQSSFCRRLGINLFSNLLSVITKRKYTDLTSGFRAYNQKTITFFGKRFKQEIETVMQFELVIHYAGLKAIEVPVTMKPRITGRSEINFANALKFPIYNIVSFFGTLVQRYK